MALVASMGCADRTRPFTAADRATLDRETHLTDMPSGRAEPGDAVVRVISHGTFCSGALVGDALVVTAGHCVGEASEDGVYVTPPGYVRVELGKEALPWGRVGARDVLVCDGWDGGFARDVAAIVLEARVPADVPRLHARIDDGEVGEPGAPFVSRGFGTAMKTQSIEDWGTTWSTERVERAGQLSWSADSAFAVEMPSANGDSGGPVLARGSNDVVGVASERRETAGGPMLTYASRLSSCRATLRQARALASMI